MTEKSTSDTPRESLPRRELLKSIGLGGIALALGQFTYKTVSAPSWQMLGGETYISLLPGAKHPAGGAFTPDDRLFLVAAQDTHNLAVIDVASLRLHGLIALPNGDVPWGIAISREGRFAYITNSGYYSRRKSPGTVSVVDILARKGIASIPVGIGPNGIDIDHRRSVAFVANQRSNSVSVIDLKKRAVVETIPVGRAPHTIRVTPDGKYVAVVNYEDASLSVISPDKLKILDTITVGVPALAKPNPAWGPGDTVAIDFVNYETAWVTNSRSKNIVEVNLRTGEKQVAIYLERMPIRLAILHGELAFITFSRYTGNPRLGIADVKNRRFFGLYGYKVAGLDAKVRMPRVRMPREGPMQAWVSGPSQIAVIPIDVGRLPA
jgi:YVTN family beta-propeller protein